jgi:phage portal protein BeeE
MGFLSRVSTVVSPARIRAQDGAQSASQRMTNAFWSGDPIGWFDQLVAAGVTVTPELALTLSAYYCAVTTIAYDLATLPLQVFKYRDDGGKDRVRGGRSAMGTGGIGSLVMMLRWQPNSFQTWTEFALAMIAQFLMREVAYAEIVAAPPGSSSSCCRGIPIACGRSGCRAAASATA